MTPSPAFTHRGPRPTFVALVAGAAVLAGCGGFGTGSDSDRPGGAARLRAIDGDTFAVGDNRARVTVRVALIDAGESSATRYGQPTCGGAGAERFARAWAARRGAVRLRPVPGLPREDRYRRRLARIVDREGRDYGMAAVRRGWARVTVYEPPRGRGAGYLARLRAAEAAARDAVRGAWSRCGWEDRSGVE